MIKKVLFIFSVFIFMFSCKNEIKKVEIVKKEAIQKKDTIVKPKYPQYLTKEFIMGKFDPSKHERFIRIEDKYTNKHNVFLDKDAYNSFLKMYNAAYKDGFKLMIVSATRPFNYQKRIWERNWKKRKKIKDPVKRALDILRFSSMPGTSRHHWGTEVDLNVLENKYYDKGEGKRIFDWMTEHAHEFGFYRPYTAGRKVGYNEEKWHWSYLPISKTYTNFAKENMKDEYINGFSGSETAKRIGVTQKYILGINPECF